LSLRIEYDSDREDARNEIERFCEECGRHGRFRHSPSRSLTLCDRHARLAQPTLPDDAVIADPASDGGSMSELPSE
jgi:hypothetical protein